MKPNKLSTFNGSRRQELLRCWPECILRNSHLAVSTLVYIPLTPLVVLQKPKHLLLLSLLSYFMLQYEINSCSPNAPKETCLYELLTK